MWASLVATIEIRAVSIVLFTLWPILIENQSNGNSTLLLAQLFSQDHWEHGSSPCRCAFIRAEWGMEFMLPSIPCPCACTFIDMSFIY